MSSEYTIDGSTYTGITGIIPGNLVYTGAISTQRSAYSVVIPLPNITMQMLAEHPALTASVEELVNMWLVRYGADWVKCEDVDEDFYRVAYARLKQIGRMEEFYVSDTITNVVRVVGGK